MNNIIIVDDKTKVVNCRVKYIRPKYDNLKEWIEDPLNYYIGRQGIVFIPYNFNDTVKKQRFPNSNSIFSNPFTIKKTGSRERSIQLFEDYIIKKIEKNNLYVTLLSLKGKRLGCWCKVPGKNISCHGDIIIKLLNRYERTGSLRCNINTTNVINTTSIDTGNAINKLVPSVKCELI